MPDECVFEGRLGVEDMARHVPHRFAVPLGTRTLRVAFHATPEHPGVGEVPHQLSIAVYGPGGPRGTRHCNADQSPVISERFASPGYMPGPIEPGAWVVEIDTHRILPPGNLAYTLRVTVSAEPVEGPAPARPATTAPRGPGWYLGDLHGHSYHSDADWSVADFIAEARRRGLDFVTLTDHNTVSGLPEARALGGDDLLVMGGVELTTFHGHALALGARAPVEWRIRDGETMSARARDLMAAGLTFVVAHPMAIGHPWCTGCTWAYADVFPGPARVVEVWNGDWGDEGSQNALALRLFQVWLNAGYRMRATAASDTHGPARAGALVGATRVFAEALEEAAILRAVRAGHAVLTAGADLMLEARAAGGEPAIPGDLIDADGARIALSWSGAPEGAVVTLIGGARGADVVRLATAPAGSDGDHEATLENQPEGAWCLAELRDAAGRMLAMTNPIFFRGDWR